MSLLLPNLEAAVVEAAERHDLRAAQVASAACPTAERTAPPAAAPPASSRPAPHHGQPDRSRDRLRAPAPARRPARAGRRGRRPLLIGTGGLALAGITAALFVGVNGGGKLDVIAEAQAALAPAGHIIHADMLIEHDALYNGKPVRWQDGILPPITRMEQWSAQDPARTHLKTHASPPVAASAREPARYGVKASQRAWTKDSSSYLDGRKLESVTAMSPDSADLSMTGLLAAAKSFGDLRTLLAAGRLRDRGLVTVEGRQLWRLTGIDIDHYGLRSAVEFDLDPATFEPARFEIQTPAAPKAGDTVQINTATIQKFDRIPLTAETAKLLTIQPPAGTTIRSRTQKEIRIWQNSCRDREKSTTPAAEVKRLTKQCNEGKW